MAPQMSGEPGAYAYMLRCADGSYYVGSARLGLEQRVGEHNAGTYGGYTSIRRPVTLVWAEHFQFITDAIAAERRIKGWSRAKKEALIQGDYEAIKILARRAAKLPQPRARCLLPPFETLRCATLLRVRWCCW